MNLNVLAMILATLLLHGCATPGATLGAKQSDSDAQAKYEQLRARYESGDIDVGIRDLRRSYVRTAHYAPYGGAIDTALRALTQQANSRNFKACLDEVRNIEPRAFPTLELHHFGWMCAHELGEVEEALRHERMARAIFADIVADGDGTSTDEAWQTISTNELYLVLAIQGLQPKGQALVQSDGRAFDLMTVQPKEGGPEEVRYFDVSFQMSFGMEFLDDQER